MEWFQKILEQQKEARVLQTSEGCADKGTKRSFRMYTEIKRVGGYDENKVFKSL